MSKKCVSVHLGPIVRYEYMNGSYRSYYVCTSSYLMLQVDIVTVSLSQRTAKLAKIRAVYLFLLGLAILA